MKTSIVFIAAILLNTMLLLSEPLTFFKEHINTWFLLIVEVLLLIGFYLHRTIKQVREACELDFDSSDVFVITNKNKKNSPK